MLADQSPPSVDKPTVTQCFNCLYSPTSTTDTRKRANQHLIEL